MFDSIDLYNFGLDTTYVNAFTARRDAEMRRVHEAEAFAECAWLRAAESYVAPFHYEEDALDRYLRPDTY